MRRLALLLAFLCLGVQSRAEDLIIVELGGGLSVAVGLESGDVRPLGVFESVTTITPDAPTPPTPEPTDIGQVICLRPWSCTLDESDADLTIRESIDAVKSDVPYISLLPGTMNESMQAHAGYEHYRKLVPDTSRPYCFHVAPTANGPAIVHEGPLDADTVLGWIDVPRVNLAPLFQAANEDQWLDIEFDEVADEDRLGALPPDQVRRNILARLTNVRQLQGFQPIPKSEWSAWTARFPVSRLAQSIRHITDQVMGSCVGHSACNGMEGGTYMQAGDFFFRRLSPMSMYVRIGRSPNSGAYVGDAADELFDFGILPANGETDADGKPYSHTHQISGGFSTRLPSGWQETAKGWRSIVYSCEDQEAAFRVLMDNRLRTHFGRSSHAISGFAVTSSGKWAYENSWSSKWGDLGKSVGYDSRFYDSYVYHPVLRDEVKILIANKEPVLRN